MSEPDWWQDFFTGLFVEFWIAAIPPEITREDADFFFRALELSPGERVLDVPCGHGRFTLELASRGCRMTGLDLSPEFLAAARKEARRQGLEAEWHQGDMRQLPWRSEFDAAFCAGNSFGYFDDARKPCVPPGGRRGPQTGRPFPPGFGLGRRVALFRTSPRSGTSKEGGIRFQAENRYEPRTGRVENVYTVEKGDRRQSRTASHRLYTCREIRSCSRAPGSETSGHSGPPRATPLSWALPG